jgi:UDP-N-acetylglucosamine--N-acetylmuramyl-(pentapeptide) pyrophosphoryl-undecaprenol N-acetylglucosamine transferase
MTVLPLLMASWYGLSTAIHQSDSITGRANAVLSRFVRHRFSAFPMTHKGRQTVWTPVGMPIRCTFQPLPPHKNVSLPLRILIVGGSQGAHFWSLLWPRALALLSPQSRACLEVRHQCPASDLAMLRTSYGQSGLQASQWDVSSFFHHMPDQLEWAHVVFARSGASTLAELAVACRPVFLVPYPQATQNHQWHNATLHLANHPGWIMNQEALSAEVLAGLLQDWIDDTQKLCHANEYSSSPFCPLLSCDHMYQIVCGSMSK